MIDKQTTFFNACKAIRAECPDPYAKAYAQGGMDLATFSDEAMRVQSLYILGNITHWRGDRAKEIRAILKSIANV